jgi:hypothetical protein
MWIVRHTTSLLGYQGMFVLPRRVAPYQDVFIVLRPCQLHWRDCSSCASSFIPFALSGSHYRCAPRIAPLTLRGISLCALHKGQFNLRCELRKARSTTARCAWYNSSSKLQYTLFLKLGSHDQRVSLNGYGKIIEGRLSP